MKNNCIILFVAGCLLISCRPKGESTESQDSVPVAEKALTDTSSIYYADYNEYPDNIVTLPIGVFDSGTGGLTVLEAFLGLDLFNNSTGKEGADGVPDYASENFTYLADQANMPYGNYASAGKQDYLRELVVKDALFLTTKPNRSKIVVIACNTATAYGLSDVGNMFKRGLPDVSVVGVINAGVNASLDQIGEKEDAVIGVMATVGTISSQGYQKTIINTARDRGYKGNLKIVCQSGLGFAEAVDMEKDFIDKDATGIRENYRGPALGTDSLSINPEMLDRYNFHYGEGAILLSGSSGKITKLQLNSAGNYARFHLVSLIEKHRQQNNGLLLKNIILGCTHYPFLIDTLRKVLSELVNYKKDGEKIYAKVLADDIEFIDPAVYTAREVYSILSKEHILRKGNDGNKLKAYISVPAKDVAPENLDEKGNLAYDFKYGRAIGSELQTVDIVPFSSKNINPYNLARIRERLPLSYRLINKIIE